MHPPIFVREPNAEERARLEAASRASDAFTVRRSDRAPERGGAPAQARAHQPGSGLRAKERRRDRLTGLARRRPGRAFGFADEVWFSRLARPALHAWAAAGGRLRLAAHAADPADPEAKALACYG